MTEARVSLEQSLLLQAIEQISAVDHKIGVLQGQMNHVIGIQEKLDKIDAIGNTVARIAPLVDKHEQKHNREEGAKTFALSAGSVIGKLAQLIVGAIGGTIVFFLERMFHR